MKVKHPNGMRKAPYREANFPFSGDFEDAEPELVQCDCCGKMVPEEEIAFIPADRCSAGDTYACEDCRRPPWEKGPSEAEIARSQAMIAAVLGPEEVAKLEAEALPVICDICGKPIEGVTDAHRHLTKWNCAYVAHESCFEEEQQADRGPEYQPE